MRARDLTLGLTATLLFYSFAHATTITDRNRLIESVVAADRASKCEKPSWLFTNSFGFRDCKFVTTTIRIDSTTGSHGLLDAPTYLVIAAWRHIPGIGWIVGNAYEYENRTRKYKVLLKTPPGYDKYNRCFNFFYIDSNRHGDAAWGPVNRKTGILYFWASQPGYFQGRNWIKGRAVWKAVHPDWERNVASRSCEAD